MVRECVLDVKGFGLIVKLIFRSIVIYLKRKPNFK